MLGLNEGTELGETIQYLLPRPADASRGGAAHDAAPGTTAQCILPVRTRNGKRVG